MRLIDVDALRHRLLCQPSRNISINFALELVSTMPTVDAEVVVRCDDCIYRDGKTPGQPNILCWQMHSDDYCSYGTKREIGTYCPDIMGVVRCKDCVHNQLPPTSPNADCELWYGMTDLYGYCHYGERRENGETN